MLDVELVESLGSEVVGRRWARVQDNELSLRPWNETGVVRGVTAEINRRVDSMVVRMQDVLACEGQMNGW